MTRTLFWWLTTEKIWYPVFLELVVSHRSKNKIGFSRPQRPRGQGWEGGLGWCELWTAHRYDFRHTCWQTITPHRHPCQDKNLPRLVIFYREKILFGNHSKPDRFLNAGKALLMLFLTLRFWILIQFHLYLKFSSV